MPVKTIVYGKTSKSEKNFANFAARLDIIKERLEDPQPALNSIVAEFGLMEAQRFLDGGFAPEFGINKAWTPISKEQGYNRNSEGGNKNTDQTLLNFGYLARAASNPELDYVGVKAVKMIIDPTREAPRGYSHGRNYGEFHQHGLGQNPKREIVTITPAFVKIANKIIKVYVLEGAGKEVDRKKVNIPSNTWRREDVKAELRKYERRMERRKAGLRTFGESHIIHSGRGIPKYEQQSTFLGGGRLGKRGY